VAPNSSRSSSNLVEHHSSQGKEHHSSNSLHTDSHMATRQQLLQATMEVPQVCVHGGDVEREAFSVRKFDSSDLFAVIPVWLVGTHLSYS
jgi:hypothetical protein